MIKQNVLLRSVDDLLEAYYKEELNIQECVILVQKLNYEVKFCETHATQAIYEDTRKDYAKKFQYYEMNRDKIKLFVVSELAEMIGQCEKERQ